ncbi:hypothetical protein ONZ43_g4129 [Nemania bipapillata]|uniref:Uncharacterized protein n=1 Tax=Nemania bipapillata TaxID=110536 RepID=A0ACC2IRC6_9PEZI|nr:hypothetical protein ONZ43_g4129 [Nemania bipapillata]
MARISYLVGAAAALLATRSAADELFTPKHEAGRCALRGHCGKKGFFGKALPCVDNGLAETPDDDFAREIEELCGPKWKDTKVCCNSEQLNSLKNELSTPNQIIGSCPACKDNFYNLFCTFTCSPDQSLFVNVTRTQKLRGGIAVAEIDQLITKEYGEGFYDSCKDVKFGPTNSKAIDFIGGSASNYTELLKFLGKEQAIGSPFQINFPPKYSEPRMAPQEMKPKKCNDEDPNFRLILVVVLSVGWIKFELEKEPVRLWVSPDSPAAQEKAFFDEHFGPFYRAQKVFLVNDTSASGTGPVLSYDTLTWWADVEKDVRQLKGHDFGTSFQDVCFKPTGSACVVQSPTIWFDDTENWKPGFRQCASSPVLCRPDFEQPIEPNMILGGFEGLDDLTDTPAITVTWVVNNFPEGSPALAHAQDWERALKNRLLLAQDEATARGLRLSFSTEISLEEELNQSTNTDATIVVISYLVMFLYASIALGSSGMTIRELMRNPSVALVQSKFTLGLVGILIVLMSITSSIGLFSWAGIKATLIIAEVIPFIVLAVGVDNIFLIVHEFDRVNQSNPDDMIEERIAKALGRMGPSILFSAITETVSFALGAFVGMPAVRNFAIYAAGAVFINALLQMTLFISILSYNQMRTEDARADCFPCIQVKAARIHLSSNGNNGSLPFEVPEESLLQQFIRKQYAPALLGKKVKVVIVTIFFGFFAAGLALLPYVKLGLDQRVALPDNSYLIDYFNDMYKYLDVGPPVYFVTKGLNATDRSHQQDICSRFSTCEQLSLATVLEQERKRPEVSYISSPTASWIDDFFLWLKPENEDCCNENGKVCFAERNPPWNITLSGMPEGDEFIHYLEKFLSAPTTEDCPLGGRASYSSAVVVDSKNVDVPASHFRTAHEPLRSQDDFINAYAAARRIAREVSASTGADIFPYSVFYIFFDQYASIVKLTGTLLGSALGIIYVVSCVLLGSVVTALVVTITVAMIIIDIIGAMAVFDVSLNAVSLVNLIICVGIGVEFCAHIARAFMFPSGSVMERAKKRFRGRDARAWTALINVGGSVFSGITVTKLLGVCVLAFTRSKIFEIYYFRVWLALVFFAATHALIFLPVALSLVGGEGYADPESEGGLAEDLASRRRRGLLPDEVSDSEDEYED